MPNASQVAYQLAFQLSPIILTGGAAQLIPGGMLPIISITEAINFTTGLLSGSDALDLNNFFASFAPLTGGTLIDVQVANVPFANQAVAANAVIAQPLRISLKMTCPARSPGGFAAKLATIQALQAALKYHVTSGGTFTVVTPSMIYPDCLLIRLEDVGAGQPSQPQSIFRWDFYQPLLQANQLQGVLNTALQKMNSGLPTTGATSGLETTIGSTSVQSLATPQLAPAASNLTGSNIGIGGF